MVVVVVCLCGMVWYGVVLQAMDLLSVDVLDLLFVDAHVLPRLTACPFVINVARKSLFGGRQ